MTYTGSLNPRVYKPQQRGWPRGDDHPHQIKTKISVIVFSSLNGATYAIHTLPEHLGSTVPGSQAVSKEWEEIPHNQPNSGYRKLGHMTPTTLLLPPLFPAIKMSRKLMSPTARETICYKYREVWLAVSMTIHVLLWKATQWLVCHSKGLIASSMDSFLSFYSILYLSYRSYCHGLRVTTLSTTWFFWI